MNLSVRIGSKDRARTIVAVAATIAGLSGMAYSLFAPLGRTLVETVDENGIVRSSVRGTSAFDAGIAPEGVVLLGLASLAFISLPFAAIAAARGQRAGRYLLRLAAGYVLVVSILGLMTVGVYLLPGAGLAFLAAVGFDDRRNARDLRKAEPTPTTVLR